LISYNIAVNTYIAVNSELIASKYYFAIQNTIHCFISTIEILLK